MSTVSFAENVIGISVLVQALLIISISSFADYGASRKFLMILIGVIGACSAIAMPLAFKPSLYILAGVLCLFTSVFQSTSYVFLDAYFPILTRNDPDVLEYEASIVAGDVPNESKSFDARGGSIQTTAMIVSYITGSASIVIGALVLSFISESVLAMNLLVSATGVYWLCLGIWSWANILERPGPPLPANQSYLLFSWKQIGTTISKFRQIPHTFYFLIGFFFYADAMNTLAQIAVLFCRSHLGMGTAEVLVVTTLFPITGFIGNFILYRFQQRFHIHTKTMLLFCITVLFLLPWYALLGAFNPYIGMIHKWEAYGFVSGATLTFGKVLFSELIPKGYEAEFFALSGLADRGSSWIGAFLVSGMTNAFHDDRYGMSSLIILFVVAYPFIIMIDVKRGSADAKRMLGKFEEVEMESKGEQVAKQCESDQVSVNTLL